MRPGVEDLFKDETTPLFDNKILYHRRLRSLLALIQLQKGVVKSLNDGSIVTPIPDEDEADASEYLQRLKQIRLPL